MVENANTPKKWGIYRGFKPPTDPLKKWKEPTCPDCHCNLSRWIDWYSSGSIGFCKPCYKIFLVKQEWKPTPLSYTRLETDELAGYEIKELTIADSLADIKELITFHDKIPLDQDQVHRLILLQTSLQSNDTPESYLIQHLIWSLIFNSEYVTASMVKDYIVFVYLHPHFFRIYDKFEVWVGDETDIVQKLEKNFKSELKKTIYEIWKRDNNKYPLSHFKSRIGFYVSLDDQDLIVYGKEFFDFAKKINKRIILTSSPI